MSQESVRRQTIDCGKIMVHIFVIFREIKFLVPYFDS